jgi:hypothetical protein
MRFDMGRKIGAEVEFKSNMQPTQIAQFLTNAGVETQYEGYNHSTRNHWKIVTDASCQYELVSPPLVGVPMLDQLRKAMRVMNELNCKIDKTCSVHIHHDVAGYSGDVLRRLYAMYIRFEDVIDGCHVPSRRKDNNRFCKGWTNKVSTLRSLSGRSDVNSLIKIAQCDGMDSSRYFKLNARNNWVMRGTIEFRHHGASLDAIKIWRWIQLTQVMLNRAVDADVQCAKNNSTWATFKECLGSQGDLGEMVRWWSERRSALA